MNAHIAAKPMEWVKDREGNTYICPKSELVDVSKLNKEELQKLCIDEQDKPWND
jgi:hypothetical protein